MTTFSERLRWCQEAGQLTTSDLARWFDRPRATVGTWINNRTPFGPQKQLALRNLDLLENAVRSQRGFPVPRGLTWMKRMKYVRELRDDAERNPRVPDMRATG